MCILISVRCWKVHYPGGILFSNCYDVGNPLIIYISMFYWGTTIKTHKILHRALLLNWIIKGAPILSVGQCQSVGTIFSGLTNKYFRQSEALCYHFSRHRCPIKLSLLTSQKIHDTSRPVFASHWESYDASALFSLRPSASSPPLCRRIFWLENNLGETAADQHQIWDLRTCQFVCAVEDLLLLFVYWNGMSEFNVNFHSSVSLTWNQWKDIERQD